MAGRIRSLTASGDILALLRRHMQSQARPLFLAVLVVVVAAVVVDGIRLDSRKPLHCYRCNSANDKRCGDTFDNTTMYLHRCPSNATMCTKVIVWIEGFPERIYRDCAFHGKVGWDEGRWCEARKGSFWSRAWYCYCNDKHGCNAASTKTGAASMTALTLLTTAWMAQGRVWGIVGLT